MRDDPVARRPLLRGAGLLLLAGAATGAARPARAHHGWGSYEAGSPVDATGRVERMTYGNPHAALWLATADKTWEVVLAPPSRMRARGLEERLIAAGTDGVQAYGYPRRDRPTEMRAEWVRVAGTTYQLR